MRPSSIVAAFAVFTGGLALAAPAHAVRPETTVDFFAAQGRGEVSGNVLHNDTVADGYSLQVSDASLASATRIQSPPQGEAVPLTETPTVTWTADGEISVDFGSYAQNPDAPAAVRIAEVFVRVASYDETGQMRYSVLETAYLRDESSVTLPADDDNASLGLDEVYDFGETSKIRLRPWFNDEIGHLGRYTVDVVEPPTDGNVSSQAYNISFHDTSSAWFTYAPTETGRLAHTTDSFSYRYCLVETTPAVCSDPATVTLSYERTGGPPKTPSSTAIEMDAGSTQTVTVLDDSVYSDDPEPATVTITNADQLPPGFTAVVDADRAVTVTADPDFSGVGTPVDVGYTLTDGGGSAYGSISVNVTASPAPEPQPDATPPAPEPGPGPEAAPAPQPDVQPRPEPTPESESEPTAPETRPVTKAVKAGTSTTLDVLAPGQDATNTRVTVLGAPRGITASVTDDGAITARVGTASPRKQAFIRYRLTDRNSGLSSTAAAHLTVTPARRALITVLGERKRGPVRIAVSCSDGLDERLTLRGGAVRARTRLHPHGTRCEITVRTGPKKQAVVKSWTIHLRGQRLVRVVQFRL